MTVRRVVVDHVLFVVADLDASRGLYTAALAPLGYEELYVQDDCVSYGAEDLDDFTICRGEPVTTAAHIAFSAEGRDAVDSSRPLSRTARPSAASPGAGRSTPSGNTRHSSTTCIRTTSKPCGTRPSRSSTRLAVPAFPDPYGPRYIRERSRTAGFAVDTRGAETPSLRCH